MKSRLLLLCVALAIPAGLAASHAAESPTTSISPVVRFSDCTDNGVGLFYFRGGCTGNLVQNNISAFNRTDCGYDNGGGRYGDPARNRDDYNCYHPGKPDPRLQPGEHEVLDDPLFVDAKRGDFRLQPGSPCRGKAAPLEGPNHEKMPDLGAFPRAAE